MGDPLQDQCTVIELASSGQVIEISNKISYFDGLASIVEADLTALSPDKIPVGWRDSDVHGELQFGFAGIEKNLPMVTGSARVTVDAVCQRCLEPMQFEVQIEPKLLLLSSEQSVDGYDEFEVWELAETELRPKDIVEELLIMALPLSAMHNKTADCKVLSVNDEGREELVRPFATLRSQMIQNEKDLI
ncbi:MAG: hypothetical protein HOH37_04895 [Gammaproteobacteria bacterium]|jgi:uncharacterized metal-binding protein YceD (DUF177 family)|nr:hypothetical protein [Gammaproteobacteria bacterium]